MRSGIVSCLAFVLLTGSVYGGEQTRSAASRSVWREPKRTPLHIAAREGKVEDVRRLLAEGADVNAMDESGWTPLHAAVLEAPASVVELLIASGAMVNAKNDSDNSPLEYTFDFEERGDVMELLIRHGAEFSREHLMQAAEYGYARAVEIMVEKGIDVTSRDRHGSTPLHAAAESGNREIVRLLLDKGADVNAATRSDRIWGGVTALHISAGGGYADMVDLLIRRGADIHAKDAFGRTPLHEAAGDGGGEAVRVLVRHGADVHVEDSAGQTPLHHAAMGRCTSAVRALLEHGADVNARDSEGRAPLHRAVETGDGETVEQLIKAGADPRERDAQGRTLLHVAVRAIGQFVTDGAVAPLLAAGVDVNAATDHGFAALHYVARDGHFRAAELLLAHGADANARIASGDTPLHFAVRRGYTDIVLLLVEAGADCAVKDSSDKTPLDHARAAGREDLLALLTGEGKRQERKAEPDGASDSSSVAEQPAAKSEPLTDVEAVVQGNTAFAVDLYPKLASDGGNLFFSPYSISTALAMTYAGARESTALEMAKAMHFSLDQERLHPAFAELQAGLNKVQEVGNVRLSVANSLWPQEGYRFLPEYLSLVETRYNSRITPVDFEGDRTAACATINRWVEERTENKIKNLVQPGALADPTYLVLVNAIYFRGKWLHEFDPGDTRDGTFYVSAKQSVQVPLMSQTEKFRYAEAKSLQILELPYRGGELSMLILLPRRIEGLGQLEQELTPESLEVWRASLKEQKVEVYLPKFRIELEFHLGPTLEAMGMRDAFVFRKANFAGMDGRSDWLFLGGVIHKAYVDVNEEGTEAAAATAVVMYGGAPAPPPVFRADHPFLFLIQDNRTGSLLFLGRVADPR